MYKNKLTHEFYYNTERNKVYMLPNKLQVLLYCLGSLHTSQPQYLRNLSTLNLLVKLVLPIITLYFTHPPSHLLNLLIVHTTEPLLSPGITYQNLWELSLTRHLIVQPLVNVPLYHFHILRTNFAHITKHTFRHLVPTLTFFPARTDHIDLYPNNI